MGGRDQLQPRDPALQLARLYEERRTLRAYIDQQLGADRARLATAEASLVALQAFVTAATAPVAWTPQVRTGATLATLAAFEGYYVKLGDLVVAEAAVTVNNFNAGSGTFTVTLPVAPRGYIGGLQPYMRPVGILNAILVPGGQVYEAHMFYNASNGFAFPESTATEPDTSSWTNSFPTAWLVGGSCDFHVNYSYIAA